VGRDVAVHLPQIIPPVGALNLDHIRAQVAEQHAHHVPVEQDPELDNPDTSQKITQRRLLPTWSAPVAPAATLNGRSHMW
jgi:hypothetical protein